MHQVRINLLAVVALALALSACGVGFADTPTTLARTTTTEGPLLEVAGQVEDAINGVSLLAAIKEDQDLMIAWSDLSADVTSSMRDLERSSTSVDTEGLRGRISAFENQFQLGEETAWRVFVSTFDSFIQQLPQGSY